MADYDSDSDEEQPIGARLHGSDKTFCSEQTYRMTVLFMVILIFIAAVLIVIFSLLTWLELRGEINITSAVVDRLISMASALAGIVPSS